jgi:MoaA/NifB/PqqE/SkfB family radical SAM enzyme
MSGRLWLYSNYHCNLACRYCLTESSPKVPRRILEQAEMVMFATEARELGFESLGITGGEPMLVPWMAQVLDALTQRLPVTVLTNGTLFTAKRLAELSPLAERDLTFQLSLDRPDAIANDAMRGPENFAKVVEAVPALIALGFHVRIATTLEEQSAEEARRLRALVRGLGVSGDDHVVRSVVDRGRAGLEDMGQTAPLDQMAPELTITRDGAFWSPFAPTYREGQLQTDLRVSTTTTPLSEPLQAILGRLADRALIAPEETSGFV